MTRVLSPILFLLLAALASAAQQSASSSPPPQQSAIQATIPAQLAKTLDARKLKPGDEVIAKTSVELQGNGVTVPSGSKVIGHVTQAQARSKGDPQSALGILFDKVELPDGKELPIQGQIQAVAPSPVLAPTTGPAGGGTIASPGANSQGNTIPGPTSTLGSLPQPGSGLPNNPNNNPNNQTAPGQPIGPMLNSNSHGVVGIRHLDLDKDSVLTTTNKDLKLDSGTQLLIRTSGQQSTQSQ